MIKYLQMRPCFPNEEVTLFDTEDLTSIIRPTPW